MTVYLIRHGQTEWNKTARWQGLTDTELDETGLSQAGALAGRLRGSGITEVYSSPLKRARVTAEAIGKALGLEPFFREDLREISFGHWEGLTLAELRESHAEQLRVWELEPHADPGDGIESYISLRDRAMGELRYILKNHAENDVIAIVTHGSWIRAVILDILRVPLEHRLGFDLGNAGVTILRYDATKDRLGIRTLNETWFLEQ